MVANLITDTKIVPLAGPQAQQLATSMIQQRNFNDAIKRELEPKVKKAESEVKYQAGFSPPKKPGDAVGPDATKGTASEKAAAPAAK